mmetsp:Transcript_27442/g.33618  ORF Transcript_27442/g.33618 Transcript_27442/m.33618 type:complete len:115 (-) Transcript_27442:49-393(-)
MDMPCCWSEDDTHDESSYPSKFGAQQLRRGPCHPPKKFWSQLQLSLELNYLLRTMLESLPYRSFSFDEISFQLENLPSGYIKESVCRLFMRIFTNIIVKRGSWFVRSFVRSFVS